VSIKANAPVPYRPLGHLLNVVESMNLNVTYSYEDLIFIEHNAFLFRMGKKGEDVFLYFNIESTESERPSLADKIISAGKRFDLKIHSVGLFSMEQKDNEKTEIRFFDDCHYE